MKCDYCKRASQSRQDYLYKADRERRALERKRKAAAKRKAKRSKI